MQFGADMENAQIDVSQITVSKTQCEYHVATTKSQVGKNSDDCNSEILCHFNERSPLLFSSGLSMEITTEQFKVQCKFI